MVWALRGRCPVSEHPTGTELRPHCSILSATTLHIASIHTLRRPNWALRHEFSSLLRCLPRTLACILPLQLAVPSFEGEPPLDQKICTQFISLESLCQTWTVLTFILFKTALILLLCKAKYIQSPIIVTQWKRSTPKNVKISVKISLMSL